MLKVDVAGLGNVSPGLEAVIRLIGLAGFLVPVGCPDAAGAGFLEGVVKASDSAEEVNEGRLERGHVGIGAYFGATSRPKLPPPINPFKSGESIGKNTPIRR